MAKRKPSKSTPHVVDPGTFIPPMYFENKGGWIDKDHPRGSVAPDLPRGSVTQGLEIIQAFTALSKEARYVQYMILRATIPDHVASDLGRLWPDFITAQLGTIGKAYNPLTIAQGMRDHHHGQTLYRVSRELVWHATVPRLCTDEEIANRCKNCGDRMDADGATLVDDSNRWYKVRYHHEPGPGVQQFRVEAYDLPDLPDDELVEYYNNHPLPAWYRRNINYDIHTATGPDDERFPLSTIRAEFMPMPGTLEECSARWAEEFAAEVQVCVDRFAGDPELTHELARLIAELRAYNVEDETPEILSALRPRSAKTNALNIVKACKGPLLRKLNEVKEGVDKLTTAKPAKPRPEVPTIANKFAAVPGSLNKWMGLLRAEGIVDVNGSFAMAADAKGKGKLIAAWVAASELFQLPGYSTDVQLVQALRAHLPGLSGLDRVDKVRQGKTFSNTVTRYIESLQVE